MNRSSRLLGWCAIVSLAACSSQGPAEGSVDESDPALASVLGPVLDSLEGAGLSGVVMVESGERTFQRPMGFADCAATEPMTMDHVFSIGSILKEMVRIAAYDLADDGRLTLEDPIGKWIAAWPGDKASITVRQLIEHSSGLPDIVDPAGVPSEYTPEYDFERVSRDEMIGRARKSSLMFEPGADEAYSNLGYSLLTAVLENASGQDIETILRERIFVPAGMTRTGYVGPDWTASSFAVGCREDGSRWGVPILDGRWLADGPGWNLRGNGGLYSTAGDMVAFMRALAEGGLLSDAAAKAWGDDRLAFVESFQARAMGPAGGNGINNAVMLWVERRDAQEDFAFIFMTNRAEHPAEDYARLLTRPAYRALSER